MRNMRLKRLISIVLVFVLILPSTSGCKDVLEIFDKNTEIEDNNEDESEDRQSLDSITVTGTLGPDKTKIGSDTLSLDLGDYPLPVEAECVIQPASVPSLEDVNMIAYDFTIDTSEEILSVMALTIPYDKKDLDGLNPQGNIGAAYYNESTGIWEPVSFEVNEDDETVTIYTDHLSVYGCFAVKNENTRKAYAAYAIPSFALLDLSKSDAHDIVISVTENGGDPEEKAIAAGLEVVGNIFSVGSAAADTISHTLNVLSGSSAVVAGNSLFNTIGDRLGSLGTAISIAQISLGMYRVYNGNNEEIFPSYANALKGSLIYMAGKAGMKLVSLAFLAVLVIEYNINNFGESSWDGRKDIYTKAYALYYESANVKRSARDWAIEFLKAENNSDSTENYQLKVEELVHEYTNEFWQDETVVAEYQSLVQESGFTGGGGLNEKMKEEISIAYKNNLYKGILQDAFKLIAEKRARKAEKDLLIELNLIAKELNRVCTLELYDGSLIDEELTSSKADMKAVIEVTENILDSEEWAITLDKKGSGKIQFTFLAYLMAGAPTKLNLYKQGDSTDDIPLESFEFAMEDVTQRLNINEVLEKNSYVSIYNMSGQTLVMDADIEYKDSYTNDLDGISVEGFTVTHGDYIGGSCDFVETSPTTFEKTFYIALAPVPEDDSVVYFPKPWINKDDNPFNDPLFEVFTITVKGTYNETVIVHWNGSSFTQVN